MRQKGKGKGGEEAEGRKCCFAVVTSVSRLMMTWVRVLWWLDLISCLPRRNVLRNTSKKDNDGPRSFAELNLAINTRSAMQTNSTGPDWQQSRPSRSLYLQPWLLALDASNDDTGGILGDDLVVVQHLELCGNV